MNKQNKKLKGFPAKIEVTLKTEKDIKDLYDLERFTHAITSFHQDDRFLSAERLKSKLGKISLLDDFFSRNNDKDLEWIKKDFPAPKLIKFRVNSPPELTLLIDPNWLSIFLSILSGYKSMKESLPEIKKDVKIFVGKIKGLNQKQKESLTDDVTSRVHSSQQKKELKELFESIAENILEKSKGTKQVIIKIKISSKKSKK